MPKMENKAIMNSESAKCDPLAICASFHEPNSSKKIKIGRNVLVRIKVNLLFSCVIKKAFRKAKEKLIRFDSSVLGINMD
jgi:hypothetical protein